MSHARTWWPAGAVALALLAASAAGRPASAEDPPAAPPPAPPAAVRERIAVADFAVAETLRERDAGLGARLAGVAAASLADRFDVVARADLVKALDAAKLRMADLADDAERCARVGKLVRAERVVTGRVSSDGGKVALGVRTLVVGTATFGETAAESGDGTDACAAMIPRLLAKAGLGEAAASPAEPTSLLRDLARWDAATSAQRRAAAQVAADRAAGFALLGLETFTCGGKSHEVALFRHDGTGIEFSLVPGGTFQAGSSPDAPETRDDGTPHTVTLTRPFLVARTEVTQAAHERTLGSNPSAFRGADRPVENVTWGEAQAFCARHGFALPTEAQWEWACRAGTRTAWTTGDAARSLQGSANVFDAYAKSHAAEIPYDTTRWPNPADEDMDDGFATTAPVRSFAPNAFGLFDVHGNVWEWCADWYGPYPEGSVTDPTGAATGTNRVLRGGCWNYPARLARSGYRYGSGPSGRFSGIGYRPVAAVPLE